MAPFFVVSVVLGSWLLWLPHIPDLLRAPRRSSDGLPYWASPISGGRPLSVSSPRALFSPHWIWCLMSPKLAPSFLSLKWPSSFPWNMAQACTLLPAKPPIPFSAPDIPCCHHRPHFVTMDMPTHTWLHFPCCYSSLHRPLPACGLQSCPMPHEGRVTSPAGLAHHLVLQTLFWETFSPPGYSHSNSEWETDHTLISSLWERSLSLLFTTKTSRPRALLAPRKMGTLAALQAFPTATGKSHALDSGQQVEAPCGGWPVGKG